MLDRHLTQYRYASFIFLLLEPRLVSLDTSLRVNRLRVL